MFIVLSSCAVHCEGSLGSYEHVQWRQNGRRLDSLAHTGSLSRAYTAAQSSGIFANSPPPPPSPRSVFDDRWRGLAAVFLRSVAGRQGRARRSRSLARARRCRERPRRGRAALKHARRPPCPSTRFPAALISRTTFFQHSDKNTLAWS